MIRVSGFRLDGFDWDPGNQDKSLLKHGIGQAVIEAFFQTDPYITDDTRHSWREKRYMAIGQSDERRWMIVIFTIRAGADKSFLRPISARYMHQKEKERYESAAKDKS